MKTFVCPKCGLRMACSESAEGRVVRCQRCTEQIVIEFELPQVTLFLDRPIQSQKSVAQYWVVSLTVVFLSLVVAAVILFQSGQFDSHRRELDVQFSTMIDRLNAEQEIIDTNGHLEQPKYKPEYIKALESSVKFRREQLDKFTQNYQDRYGDKPNYIKVSER